MIRLALADDHAILRGGLRQILAMAHDIEIVAEATNGQEALAVVRQQPLDVLLLDLLMPGLHILVLSMHVERPVVQRALQAGALGYATKDIHPEILLTAIRKVAAGGHFVDPALVETMIFPDDTHAPAPLHERLSAREFQILQLWAAGQRLNDIATALHLSPKTVSTYKTRIMEKLEVTSNADLVRVALQAGLGAAAEQDVL
jgi:DNA-binding NarL/FixJ family response regulator